MLMILSSSNRLQRVVPFLCLLVGIAILAFVRITKQEPAAPSTTTRHPMVQSNEFQIAFEDRGDVLLASNPLALEGLKMEKKLRSEHQAALEALEEERKQQGIKVAMALYESARLELANTPVLDYTKGKKPKIDDTSSELPYCTREQLIQGHWDPVDMDAPPYVIPTKHLRCFADEVYSTAPWRSWEWRPNDMCRMVPHRFNATAFCNIVRGGTIAIVGDSLSWEHYRSLLELHKIHPHQLFQHQSLELNMNVVHQICNGEVAALYRRDDQLQNLTVSLQQDFPTVLILNRGAHYVDDTILLADLQALVVPAVHDWFQQCTARKIDCRLYWRTSVPGHPHCASATTPVNNLTALEEMISNRNLYTERTWGYHWYNYQHQNELVLQMWQRLNLPHFDIIDAYHLNIRRPDGHRAHTNDCLHNCYPGKMDDYNRLLWHAFERFPIRHGSSARLPKIPSNTIYDKDGTEAAKAARLARAAIMPSS